VAAWRFNRFEEFCRDETVNFPEPIPEDLGGVAKRTENSGGILGEVVLTVTLERLRSHCLMALTATDLSGAPGLTKFMQTGTVMACA
jgi:hypothetical protein